MAYKVSEETKIHTTNCPCNFECQNNDKWSTCSIEGELPGGLLLRNQCKDKFCSYSLHYGPRHFCICYIRREILVVGQFDQTDPLPKSSNAIKSKLYNL